MECHFRPVDFRRVGKVEAMHPSPHHFRSQPKARFCEDQVTGTCQAVGIIRQFTMGFPIIKDTVIYADRTATIVRERSGSVFCQCGCHGDDFDHGAGLKEVGQWVPVLSNQSDQLRTAGQTEPPGPLIHGFIQYPLNGGIQGRFQAHEMMLPVQVIQKERCSRQFSGQFAGFQVLEYNISHDGCAAGAVDINEGRVVLQKLSCPREVSPIESVQPPISLDFRIPRLQVVHQATKCVQFLPVENTIQYGGVFPFGQVAGLPMNRCATGKNLTDIVHFIQSSLEGEKERPPGHPNSGRQQLCFSGMKQQGLATAIVGDSPCNAPNENQYQNYFEPVMFLSWMKAIMSHMEFTSIGC